MFPTVAQLSKVTCNNSLLGPQAIIRIVIQVQHTLVLPVHGSLDLKEVQSLVFNHLKPDKMKLLLVLLASRFVKQHHCWSHVCPVKNKLKDEDVYGAMVKGN